MDSQRDEYGNVTIPLDKSLLSRLRLLWHVAFKMRPDQIIAAQNIANDKATMFHVRILVNKNANLIIHGVNFVGEGTAPIRLTNGPIHTRYGVHDLEMTAVGKADGDMVVPR